MVKAMVSEGRNYFLNVIEVNGNPIESFDSTIFAYKSQLTTEEVSTANIPGYSDNGIINIYNSNLTNNTYLVIYSKDKMSYNVYIICPVS